MEILAIVPARKGSKGIKDKNIRIFRGKPLLAHAIECGLASGVINRIILSTDSEKYLEIGRQYGAEANHLRPAELATDETPMVDVISYELDHLHTTEAYKPDIIVLLQPTQPLRKPKHILAALSILLKKNSDSVVSVVKVPQHFSPDFVMRIREGRLGFYKNDKPPITRRQDVTNVYYRDGTIYMFKYSSFMKNHSIYGEICHPLIISAKESINIDEEQDWRVLKILYSSQYDKKKLKD